MENKLIKIETTDKEINNIQELVSGCDSAVITYGVDKEYNVYKVVSFFVQTPRSIHEFEDLSAAHVRILADNPKMALTKGYDYKVQGEKVKKCCRDYFKILLRSLLGFVKDDSTHDLRYKYEQKVS